MKSFPSGADNPKGLCARIMLTARHLRSSWMFVSGLFCAHLYGAIPETTDPAPVQFESRRIHVFDFDERGEGNVESLPRFWSPLHGDGFPRFTRAGFDESVGRSHPPSLRIESLGRDAVCHYHGQEIPIRQDGTYRVGGFVRVAEMTHSRACVSVHFLDASRLALTHTTRRTAYLAPRPGFEWIPFEILITDAPPEARFLGLAVWVLQEQTWNRENDALRIPLADVNATAWFDDISIDRLPSITITTRQPGEIVEAGGPASLFVAVADVSSIPIPARVRIVSASGDDVVTRSFVFETDSKPVAIDLSGLAPGAFDARVEVTEDERIVVSRSLRFLKQSPFDPAMHAQSRSFGIDLDDDPRVDRKTQLVFLKNQTARSVKTPLGRAGDRSFEEFCDTLASHGFLLTALVPLPPKTSGDAFGWVRDFAGSAAQTAGLLRWWQVGLDANPPSLPIGGAAATNLRQALADYLDSPRLAMPMSPLDAFAGFRAPIEQVTLPIAYRHDLSQLTERIESLRLEGLDEVGAYVPPLSTSLDRMRRHSEWIQRVIKARHAGADPVSIPQPWRAVTTPFGTNVSLDEEYLLFRTIAAMIGDARPGPALACGEGVQCLTFSDGPRSVVAIWDEASPPGGRSIQVQLGDATRFVDSWGRSELLTRDGGRQNIPISSLPVFVDDVDSWLVDFSTSMRLEPDIVESGTETVQHELVIHCHGESSRVGSGVFAPPKGITAAPRSFDFVSCGGAPVRIPVEIRYPHNVPAGRKEIVARIKLVEPDYTFEIPLTVTVQTQDLDVSGRATMVGGDLMLRHVVCNQSTVPVSFRSIADVPGRQRQYRPISNLAPGATQTIEYQFRDAGDLVGRRINLALRELNDGVRRHSLELIVP